jgi:predicted amidohydrolase
MNASLRVALAQAELVWHDVDANHAEFEAMLANAAEFDLLVLPEMFASGFSMQPEVCAQRMDGPSITWMRDMAERFDAAVCGSLAVNDGGKFVNRFVFVHPDGVLDTYDKRHGFTLAGEHKVYANGGERLLISYRGWRIAPFVCYDLRFPVWCRHAGTCDLMLFVANWPNPRRTAWNTLLRARAIENQCYVAGVNRVGTDQNDKDYFGDSALINLFGDVITSAGESAKLAQASISLDELNKKRERLPFYRDADTFEVTDP